MRCECCGRERMRDWVCQCAAELFCRTCNHCAEHCKCAVAARNLDMPLNEQLAVAKHELRRIWAGA